MNSFAIFTADLSSNIDLVERLKRFIIQKFCYSDFLVFTEEAVVSYDSIATLIQFYIKFYKGTTLFLTIEDYLQYKDEILGPVVIYLNQYQIIDRSIVKQCDIITESNNKLVWVKNYGI